MTQQFKFGDRVRDTALGLGECVVINASENSVYIMNERGDYRAISVCRQAAAIHTRPVLHRHHGDQLC